MNNKLNFEIASSVYNKITDGTHDSPKQSKNGKYLITSKHIKGRNIDFDTAYLISEEDFSKINERSQVHKWDVIVSMIGEYCGYCYIERNDDINYAVKNVGLYKAGSKLEADWLYYYLISPIGKQFLNSVKSGSSQPYLTLGGLRNLPILKPKNQTIKENIVKVLSDLDAKIEINNNINLELESMSKLLYDYWFVQFDFPDANGKPYKSSGGKMVYNKELKREIPDRWEVNLINDIIEVRDGTHDSPKPKEKGFHLITSKNLKIEGLDFENANLISEEDYLSINKRSKVEKGDILFSMIGNIGTIYKVEEENINFAIKNVALYKTSKKEEYKNFIYMFLKSIDMDRYMRNVISGSIQKFIGLNSLRNTPILINETLIKRYNESTHSIFVKLENSKIENQKLSELRDWLLPMLMNGQVTVGDAEEKLGMVAEDGETYKS